MTHVEEIAYAEPAEAFAPLAGEPYALLFDSALRSARLGRYAYIAALPYRILTAKDGVVALDGRVEGAEGKGEAHVVGRVRGADGEKF